MPTEFAPADPLIDSLVADLRAVTPRRLPREAALLAGLVVLETLLFLLLRDTRPDMPQAMTTAAFWWKSASLAIVAITAAAAALVSLDPAVTTGRRLSRLWTALAIIAPAALALGWLIDAGASGGTALLARLDWQNGLDCLLNIALLSLPPVLALGVLMRRGAPTRPGRTALAAGLAAAGFGAFIFAFHCDHDDPLYILVWYAGAVALVAGVARLVLPRLTRW